METQLFYGLLGLTAFNVGIVLFGLIAGGRILRKVERRYQDISMASDVLRERLSRVVETARRVA